MRFINPKTDFAFKKIFGSKGSEAILLSLLNALLRLEAEQQIEKVDIIDPYQAPVIKGMKDTYLDVRAQDRQGKAYIIEMQVLNVPALEKRILYNACKAYANQLRRGESYGVLTDVIAITITDFIMFPRQRDIINVFYMQGGGHDGLGAHLYSEDLQLVFAELPKFKLSEGELETALDRWFYFLKHADDLEAVPGSLQADPAIAHALAMANHANLSPQEEEAQDKRLIFIQDQLGRLAYAEARRSGGAPPR